MLQAVFMFWEKRERSVCDWQSVIQFQSSAYVCYKLFSYVLGKERVYVIEDQCFKAVPMYVT